MNEKKRKVLKLIGKTVIFSFAGFGVIFILILLGVLSLMSPKSKLSAVPSNAILTLDLNSAYAEVRQDDLFAEFTNQSVYSVFDLTRAISAAAGDNRVKALSATLNQTSLSFAQIEDLAQALAYFKAQGKKTYLFSNGLGDFGQGSKEYALATLFDEIWMQPNTDIGMTGVDIEVPFFKKIFDKIGVTPEFYTRYEYKTAVSSLLNADFTPTYKEELEKLGGGLFDELVEMMAKNRAQSPDEIKKMIDDAPVFANMALEKGLIDKIGYLYQMKQAVQKETDAEFYDVSDYMAHISDNEDESLPQIAFLVLEGMIESGESSNNPLNDAVIGSQSVLNQIEELKNIKNLRALVLRINSPGGSYAASDEIRAALIDLKNSKNIPIVVSMSTYAASGGYFISLAGDYIFADAATITGSIGVLGGKFVIQGLTDKLDINFGEIKFGQNAGILSINHPFSESERQVFEKSLDVVYQDFTTKVSEARGIDMKKMDEIARGRVFIGREAQKLNLVDEIGGLTSAIGKAKTLAGIDEGQKFALNYYPRRETFQEKLTKFVESGGNLPMMKILSGFEEIKAIERLKHDAVLPPMIVKM